MSVRSSFLRLLFLLWLVVASAAACSREAGRGDEIAASALPPEARQTLALIHRGGPFPYPRDGAIFGNFERRLPLKPRGYYREYTVKTPWLRHRGARRIVTGGSEAFFYTDDHYRTFRRIRVADSP